MDGTDMKEILWRMGIEQLNAMQQDTVAAYRKGQDLVLLSPTGSGKTLAFLLPLVQSLDNSTAGVQAVVLVPSRELALQTDGVFKSMGTPFRAMSCYGGRPAMEEHRALKQLQPQVIIATPGRMNDHLSKGNIDVASIHTLVIDEFDKCLELGFRDEMKQVVDRLPVLQRKMLLSATDAEEIPLFVSSQKGYVRLNYLSSDEQVPERIRLYAVHSPEKDKLETLRRLLCTLGEQTSLVFVNYRESVERVGAYLKKAGIACETFHGGMEQKDRERALYKFCNGSCSVFVSTDLAARGLDIPDIDNIVHYHLPLNEEAYIHRNGRTARWDAEGNAYMIFGPEERKPDYIHLCPEQFDLPQAVPSPVRPRWATLYIGKGKKDKINKIDIAGFLYKTVGLERDDVGRIDVKDHYAFVAVRTAVAGQVLRHARNVRIKGVKTIVEESF
ncbi:MAG: DEAD/DEAH box helicase [Paraprevotella sp.]|nr:DEAD/DEAH box helicase [Paraprevotella sp.]